MISCDFRHFFITMSDTVKIFFFFVFPAMNQDAPLRALFLCVCTHAFKNTCDDKKRRKNVHLMHMLILDRYVPSEKL